MLPRGFVVVRRFYFTAQITEEKLRAMQSGCTIDGVRYKGMLVRVEGGGGKGREGRNAWLTIECTEGKVSVCTTNSSPLFSGQQTVCTNSFIFSQLSYAFLDF